MNAAAYAIYRGYAEFHVRNIKDFDIIVPGCTFCEDTDPVLISRFADLDAASEALTAYSSDVRVYDAYAVRGYNVAVTEYWIASLEDDDDCAPCADMFDYTPFVDEIHIFGFDYTYDPQWGWIEKSADDEQEITMSNTITTSAGTYLGLPDLDIIDDYMTDDELLDHRDQILLLMRTAVQEIKDAASHILVDLYYEAAAHHGGHLNAPKSFTLRTSDYHDYLNDALNNLREQGFFTGTKEASHD